MGPWGPTVLHVAVLGPIGCTGSLGPRGAMCDKGSQEPCGDGKHCSGKVVACETPERLLGWARLPAGECCVLASWPHKI